MRSPGGYVPAIDGLRALAVSAVLLFHAGVPGATGGYLGVSVFFTISGFVITRSLTERAAVRPPGAAPLALGQFYARRVRRLLPASLITIAVCAVCARAGWLPQVSAAELRWTTLNVANWYHWNSGADYAALFAGRGDGRDPLVHFWSLAIEEQFYVVWPLVMLVLLRLPRRVAGLIIATITFGLAALVVAVGPDAGARTVYYHTLFRVPEVLVGCLLAVLTPHVLSRSGVARAIGLLGAGGLTALVALVTRTGAGSDAWPYQGLLPVFAACSGLVVVAACVPGPVARVLALRPLVEVGRISYGAYLFHWPIFVVMLERGWSAGAIAGVGIPLTLALAAASFHLAEVRITRARIAVRPTLAGAATALVAVLAAVSIWGGRTATTLAMPELDPELRAAVEFAPVRTEPASAPTPSTERSVQPSSGDSVSTSPSDLGLPVESAPLATIADTVPPTAVSTPVPDEPLRVLVVGDSTGESLSVGLAQWALENTGMQVSVAAFGGCGLMRGGEYQLDLLDAALQVECSERHARTIPEALPLADVVVVLVTLADVWERSWDGGTTWLGPDDTEFRDRLVADYTAFADQVHAAGVPTLMWLRPPVTSYGTDGGAPAREVSFGDGTQAWIESVVTELANQRPEHVRIADLRGWMEQSPLAGDPAARPDGTHFSADAALRVSREWLVPQLTALPRRA